MAIIIIYSRTQSCCIAYVSIMENYTSFKMLVLKKSYIYECASAVYEQGCVLHKCQEIQAEATEGSILVPNSSDTASLGWSLSPNWD